MKAYVITLNNNQYSQQCAQRCIESAKKHGLEVEKFTATDRETAWLTMELYDLEWTWAEYNTRQSFCPKTGLHQHPYGAKDLRAVVGCAMSHFRLWKKCVYLNEPICILEHDAVFINDFPHEIDFHGICQLNNPTGCTPRGNQWAKTMIQRGGSGVFPKTWIREPGERATPDGLAGNSAYVIKPHAAKELIDLCYDVGVWPNDALMCKQLLPYLEEYYPFITAVKQTQSTTVG